MTFRFGPHAIPANMVFASTPLSFAFVNLRPVLPGHVLVSPVRSVSQFEDLHSEELSDLFALSQRVGTVLKREFSASSLTISIQDGPDAGQTVPHVHVHVIPRKSGDFKRNDDVYDRIEKEEMNLDSEFRKDRPADEREAEAQRLRRFFGEPLE